MFTEVRHGISLALKKDHVMQIIFSAFSRRTSERLMKSALTSTDGKACNSGSYNMMFGILSLAEIC